MAAVAIAGVAFEVPTWWRLSAEYRTKADYCAWAVGDRRMEAHKLRTRPESPHSKEISLQIAYHVARVGDEYEALRKKYDRAARYPWLSVAPDPPDSDYRELLRIPGFSFIGGEVSPPIKR
jgi:hypothetical protein